MAVQHRNIPDAQLHEPKGVANATSGTVYTADGSGSGDWEYPLLQGQGSAGAYKIPVLDETGTVQWVWWPFGYGYYQHGTTGQVINTTFSKLQIDGAGANTNTSNLPPEIRGGGDLWDTATDVITPISEEDAYHLRVDIPVTGETGNPADITVQLDIGGTSSPTVPIVTWFAKGGKSLPYTLTESLAIFCRSTFLANGGQIFIKTDTGTLTLGSPAITLVRINKGDI